jgi:hypothetical protein
MYTITLHSQVCETPAGLQMQESINMLVDLTTLVLRHLFAGVYCQPARAVSTVAVAIIRSTVLARVWRVPVSLSCYVAFLIATSCPTNGICMRAMLLSSLLLAPAVLLVAVAG